MKAVASYILKPFKRGLTVILDRVYGHRIRNLEYGSKKNHAVVAEIAEYLLHSDVPGDYMEFGVYRADTFVCAYRHLSTFFPEMKFCAFDSWEGLPEPKGLDQIDGYSGGFFKGQYKGDYEGFWKLVETEGLDRNKVRAIKGWFNETLLPDHKESNKIGKAAFAWIDCDLYESTLPVLEYLVQRISVGSVLAFDDWRCYRNLPDRGQQRACSEWLERYPGIRLYELCDFGWNGKVFTVGAC